MADKVEVHNPNAPGHVTRVDAAKYTAMRDAILATLGADPMTAKEMKAAALPRLPDDLFPGGATAGWWQKTVQLDLEARGDLIRHQTKPLTWSRPGSAE